MTALSVLLQNELKRIAKTSAFRILLIVFGIITLGFSAGISLVLNARVGLLAGPGAEAVSIFMGLLLFFLPMIELLLFLWAFSTIPIAEEKTGGSIESLLATPAGPKDVWAGKTLSIFLPGFAASIISTVIVVLSVNLMVIRPATGSIILPATGLITGLIVDPLLMAGLIGLVVFLSLVVNADAAIIPSFVVGFGLMIGIPLGVGTGAFDFLSSSFTLWFAAGTCIFAAAVVILGRVLTSERIILSA